MIYCKNGVLLSRFSEMVWKNMGSDKNGWVEITKDTYDTLAADILESLDDTQSDGQPKAPKPAGAAAAKQLDSEKEYTASMARFKGLKADGLLAEALVQLEAAAKIKDSSYVKGQLTLLKKEIAAAQEIADLLKMGDDTIQKDPDTAKEFYESVLKADPKNEYALAQIKIIEELPL